jgi:hypothetical protein
MTINTTFLAMTLAALFALPLNAAEGRQEAAPSPDSSGQIDLIRDDDVEPADVSEEQTSQQSSKPAPQGDNLRSRDIGDAFKNFQPSEEISADNAVPFPVDI